MRKFFAVIVTVVWVLCVGVVAAASFRADIETQAFGTVTYILTDAPCAAETITALIPEDVRSVFKAGEVNYHGKMTAACWSTEASPRPMPPGFVFIYNEEGYVSFLRIDNFKSETGAQMTDPNAGPPANDPVLKGIAF